MFTRIVSSIKGETNMTNVNDRSGMAIDNDARGKAALHATWAAFIRYCAELKHGEIDRLSIQDGLPVLAEVTKKKVKFTNS
jgi:hypothetical protein